MTEPYSNVAASDGNIKHKVLDCEEPLRDIRAFAAALAALSIVNPATPSGSRDEAMHLLSLYIGNRAAEIGVILDLHPESSSDADEITATSLRQQDERGAATLNGGGAHV